jgi:hypothetical protein
LCNSMKQKNLHRNPQRNTEIHRAKECKVIGLMDGLKNYFIFVKDQLFQKTGNI